MLREEKQVDYPENLIFSKFRGPTFDREAEIMGRLRSNLEDRLKSKLDDESNLTFGRSVHRAAGLGGFDYEDSAGTRETEGATPRESDSPRHRRDFVRDPFELL